METGKKGIELIKKYEGFRADAYRCPAGILTIGYGHTGNVKEGDSITEQEAEDLLRQDLKEAEKAVETLVKKPINQNQFDSLVSFVYNLGYGSFASSNLLKKVNADPADKTISDEFAKWVKASGKTLPGLVARRKEESELYFL